MSTKRGAVVACVALGYALLVCALWHRTILGGQVGGWDCVLEYWPDLEFQVNSIRHHTLPLWCPWSLGGYPFSADLQSGFYSPVNWICIALGLGFGAGAWLIQLKVMLTMLVGLCGMHALIWHRTRSHAAAFVAAITYVIGSPLLVHKNGAFLWPLLYLPWAVLALSRLCDAPSLRRGAQLGLAIWLCGSAGHPQAFFYDLLVIGAYALVRVRSRGQLPGLAIAVGVAALTLLVIYVPALDAVAMSGRATRDAGYVLDNALPARELLELVIPNLDTNWQLDIYVGPLAIVGAIWAVIAARTRAARRELVFWIAVAIIGVVLAMGREGHLLALCYRFVPGFTLFRIAYRLKVIFGFAAALLAGEGVAAATRSNLRVAASIAGVWIIAGLAIARTPYSITQAVILALALVPWRPRLRGIALGAIVLVDLWAAGASKLAIVQPRPDPHAHAEIVAQMPGAGDRWRYHVDDVALPYGGTLPYEAAYHYAIRELSGYGNPIASSRVLAAESAAQHEPQLLAHFGVKYFLGGHLRPSGGRAVPALRGFVLLDDDVAAIATLYPAAERVTERGALDRLRQTTPSKLDRALVEADAPLALPVSSFAPVMASASYAPGAISVDVTAPAAGVLVVAESWAPGWTARIDGDDAPLFRANYLSIGVIVPSGTHRVSLTFAPGGYLPLLALFVAGLAGGLALLKRRDATGLLTRT